jgi:hypothetical protein
MFGMNKKMKKKKIHKYNKSCFLMGLCLNIIFQNIRQFIFILRKIYINKYYNQNKITTKKVTKPKIWSKNMVKRNRKACYSRS